jgi:hypothetical protein
MMEKSIGEENCGEGLALGGNSTSIYHKISINQDEVEGIIRLFVYSGDNGWVEGKVGGGRIAGSLWKLESVCRERLGEC